MALPFIPMSKETYLSGLNKTVSIGDYKVKSRIGLRYNKSKGKMNGSSYFTYSKTKLDEDGCLLEVSVKIENYSALDFNVVPPRNKGGNLSCLSSNRTCVYISEGEGRLSLYFYEAPITPQTYIFKLHSKDGVENNKCEAEKSITHKIKYRRSSWWQRAMSV